MTAAEIRDLKARHAIAIALVRARVTLSESELRLLSNEAAETSAYKAHLAGIEELAVAEIVSAVKRGHLGSLVFAERAEENGKPQMPEGLSPEQAINWARKQGHGDARRRP